MNGGRLCRCGHTEVCHWNGENIAGDERFDEACVMCNGPCSHFRPIGAAVYTGANGIIIHQVLAA